MTPSANFGKPWISAAITRIEARRQLERPNSLRGPTGEDNRLHLHGRGVFLCISPWNFPLSIFTGQIAAALAAGNSVLAKPAEQTPLIAAAAVDLLHRAGVPGSALHFLPGDGGLGEQLVSLPGIAGVAFTGSMETASKDQSRAGREGRTNSGVDRGDRRHQHDDR